ncbi:RING-H2 finger protein ATL57 [Morella rubra]|uniref:RING-type E3 ubiquitin transferase n=1 Tax=Morella rubra TaxID=262757 RepID=A0A6A1WQC8_9ROSI|nr:RING-H2 finger protein ATL57 [Morella rubra]
MRAFNRKQLTETQPPLEPTIRTSTPSSAQNLMTSPSSRGPVEAIVVLAVLAVLTIALFLLGFFSICMRRFSEAPASELARRRRQRQRSQQRAMSFPRWDPPTRSTPRTGLDQMTIRSLPVYSYGGNEKYHMDCAICLTDFEENDAVKVIPICQHVFHPQCIDVWLSSHVSYPVCRATRLFDEAKCGAGSGAEQNRNDQGTSESAERLTEGSYDTCTESRVMGSISFCLRNSSCSNVADRTAFQRTLSF